MSCCEGCNGDGTLEVPGIQGEIGPAGNTGTTGATGADGTNWAFLLTSIAPDPLVCEAGGTLVQIGPDANNDGVPDSISYSFNVCNGVEGRGEPETPIGGIIMYDGDITLGGPNFDATGLGINSLDSWALCIGTNSTPDLRGRFIVSAGQNLTPAVGDNNPTYAVGDGNSAGVSIGENSHALVAAELAPHTHTGNTLSVTGGTHNHEATGDASVLAGVGVTVPDFTPAASGIVTKTDGSHTHNVSGNTGTGTGLLSTRHENRAPYFALGFIKRII